MKKLKLMTDYECFPLWLEAAQGVDNIDPDSLPISAELKHQLMVWAKMYDDTLDMADPASSGFASKSKEQAFQVFGQEIFQSLKAQLGHEYELNSMIWQ